MNITLNQLVSRTIFGCSLLMTPLMAQAVEQIEREMTVSANPNIELKVQRGKVEIIGWDKDIISVKGQLDELSEGFVFEKKGGDIIIEDKLPSSYRGNNDQGSNLVIRIPSNLALEAEGVSADYEVEKLVGKVQLSLVSGSMEVEDIEGKISLNTVSGDIKAEKLNGNIELETVSGDIKDKDVQGKVKYRLVSGELESENNLVTDLSIDQVSGDVEGSFTAAEKVKVVTVSGDIEVKLSDAITKVLFDTVSGDIEVKFTNMPNLAFEIDGGPGGRIENRLTDDKPMKTKYSSRQSIQFKTQQGSGSFNASTVSGKIKLEQ
ncbi:DUF4097 family beta strand repeat-containing protein [Shewanella sp. 10N.7]|uniref:DUF4097 family beta strand repeat-containing protein n=1 Tax=Shewanella sp. 10N.7 TaxID=2885093 RepID=UPI001E3A5B8C|nr:DUF4097 family beta strand repeat-containing protein [Shewanella sp. 10N.7]MCC4832770.1 DUF4097 family beta strand repeat-containing protein [Shewanella sp. 10N.7]